MQPQSSQTEVFNLLKLPGPSQGSGALVGTPAFTPHPWPPAKPPLGLQQPHGCGSGHCGVQGGLQKQPQHRCEETWGRASPHHDMGEHLRHNLPLSAAAGPCSAVREATPPRGAEPAASQA